MYDTLRLLSHYGKYRVYSFLSSLARGERDGRAGWEDETRGETAASLIANWLRYQNNTGSRALLAILIARSSLRISSVSLCTNTHVRTQVHVRTCFIHPPCTCTRLTGCGVSRTIYFPNLLVWWELYHLVARHSFFRSLHCFFSLAHPHPSVVASVQKCGSPDKIASSTRSPPRVRVRLITEMPFARPEVWKMLYVALVSDWRRYHWTPSRPAFIDDRYKAAQLSESVIQTSSGELIQWMLNAWINYAYIAIT